MNRFILALVLASTAVCAQDQPQSAPTTPTQPQPAAAAKPQPQVATTNRVDAKTSPTDNDLYCSGFISKDKLASVGRIIGGWDSPFQTQYSADANMNGDVYMDGGNFSKDQKFAILRAVKDPNSYEGTPGQHKYLKAAGIYYLEMGRVRVVDVQKNIAIAKVEFSCDGMVPGDIAIAWGDRPAPTYRAEGPWDFYAQPNGKTTGMVLMGKEYASIAGARAKVYINIGTNQGVKAGDYFRVTRTYPQLLKDPSDSLTQKASIIEVSQVEPLKDKASMGINKVPGRFENLPRKSIGELMVLYATPTTATATVTRSWEQLQAGDNIELMDEPPPAPPAPVAMNPPTVTCTATPATVRVGETATIRCAGTSPDNRDITYAYASDAGVVNGSGETAVLNTANAQPGTATVTTTVSDDRGQTGNVTTQVNVQAAQSPEASNAGLLNFKPNGAYVNNQAKAILDQLALRLQREAGSSAMLMGHVAGNEAARLAIARATNAKNYLVKEKGIDTSRVQVADGGPGEATVEAWFVPAGATMPQATPQPKP